MFIYIQKLIMLIIWYCNLSLKFKFKLIYKYAHAHVFKITLYTFLRNYFYFFHLNALIDQN